MQNLFAYIPGIMYIQASNYIYLQGIMQTHKEIFPLLFVNFYLSFLSSCLSWVQYSFRKEIGLIPAVADCNPELQVY